MLQVDVFVSRDLDSRINAREAAAINEWRKHSNYSIHSMRDHPGHGVGLVGASWGTDLTRNVTGTKGTMILARRAWKIAWKHMLKDRSIHARRDRWGPDQGIIDRYKSGRIL